MRKAFSFVLAFLLLASAVFATTPISVNVNQTAPVFFSAKNDAYLSINQPITSIGNLLVRNNLNSTLGIKFGNTNVVLDSENKVNITSFSIPSTGLLLGPLQRNPPAKIELRADTKNREAGIYSGTVQLVNNSNPTQIFASTPVNVLIPALETSSIDIKDKDTGLSDTKLEKGQKFTVTVNYKNVADQTDLENINVKVGVYKGDKDPAQLTQLITDINGDDLEDDKDVSDLSNGRSSSATFNFQMPFDIEDKDKYTVLAEVTANSRQTASTFYALKTKTIEASVPDDKIEFTRASAIPSSLACGANKVKIVTTIRNIGANEQDVQLFLRNTATGFEKLLNNGDDIRVDNKYDNEDDFTASLEEFVTLTDLKPGTNTYSLVAYYNTGNTNIQQDVPVTLLSCAPQNTTTTTTTTTNTNTQPVVVIPTTTVPNIPQPAATVPTTTPRVTLKDVSGFSLGSTDWVIPAVIGGVGLVIGVVVALLVIPRP